ncbi:LysR substrate-binding domain-containing protein [Vibrio rumoiensis]|uniref:LysR substrate-binding domain-containing protein n=1 Tax=Vibrio rumoiensis TaxID=76258 RepID=UPI000B5C4ACC|nr:LysR substrate-binding domain-containing protein [Vibrio rumoiensis]
MKLPPLEAVRYFEVSARHLSFTLAAEELFVSQSAVSQKVILLEERLGYKLFERKPRQLTLTEKGKQLFPVVNEALNQLHDGFNNLQALSNTRAIQVYCMPSFATQWLMPLLSQFKATHPHIELNLVADIKEPTFNSGRLDIAINHGFGDKPQMIQKELLRDYIYPVATPEMIETYQLHDLNNLNKVTLLHDSVPQAKLSTSWQKWLLDNNIKHVDARNGYRYNQADLIISAAQSGQGVALARHVLVAKKVATGKLLPLINDVTPDQSVYLTYLKKWSENPEMIFFIKWLEGKSREFEYNYHVNRLVLNQEINKDVLCAH